MRGNLHVCCLQLKLSIMPHSFVYNEENIRLLESVLGRLKFSVRPSILVKWLENFESNEIPYALSILRNFEFIDSNELLLRLDHLLKALIKNTGNTSDIILFVPFAKYGKSSTLITYPLTHLDRYKKNEDRLIISNNLEKVLSEKDITHIVFIDDFVGSGDTFINEFKPIESLIENYNLKDSVYLFCPIIMEKALNKIKEGFPYIKVLSEIRFKYLDSEFSPLTYSTYREDISNLIVNYGNQIPVNPPPNTYINKGHKNSESLISFFYRTPNNTFPIIWGDTKWTPLYPRTSKSLMNQAKFLKKDITYFLSTFFDTKLNIKEAANLIDDTQDKRKPETILRQKNNYLLISIIILKYKHEFETEKSNLFICNFLGLSKEELRLIYIEGTNKGYLKPRTYELSEKGTQLAKQLFNERKKVSIREINDKNLEINYSLFLPKTFRGSS